MINELKDYELTNYELLIIGHSSLVIIFNSCVDLPFRQIVSMLSHILLYQIPDIFLRWNRVLRILSAMT